jgi:hypothetical protein
VALDESHSRLTRLDVLLIATVALAAFAVGSFAGPLVTREALGPVDPLAHYELREDVPSRREAVAALERRQLKLRDRVAVENVARAADPSKSGTHAVTIQRLEREADGLVEEVGEARLALAVAAERAQWNETLAADAREREDMAARALVSLAALIAISLVVVVLRALTRLPIMLAWVVAGSLVALLALLAADGVGLAAALALGAVVVILVVAQGGPREQLRTGRATT